MGNNRRKTVTIIDHSLLSPPKLASALSFNHSFLDVLEEVYSKVFFWGTEIGPHFAIVSLGPLFMLDVVLQVVPLWRIEDQAGNAAVLLTLGFLPGMRVAAVTMSQSKKYSGTFMDPVPENHGGSGSSGTLLTVLYEIIISESPTVDVDAPAFRPEQFVRDRCEKIKVVLVAVGPHTGTS
ncbi:hypothetical protein DCAR_0518738 [Daucus carota subsp. sativus]|uniref:Uncharacterized protein n=1 Tax=Daucus carota subsp. sativus TaxID=79200 RepID=A0A164XG75_DAUCS|nr:hypothetical protein DCAR_0518738 [Daucus carota subsp. sativus]